MEKRKEEGHGFLFVAPKHRIRVGVPCYHGKDRRQLPGVRLGYDSKGRRRLTSGPHPPVTQKGGKGAAAGLGPSWAARLLGRPTRSQTQRRTRAIGQLGRRATDAACHNTSAGAGSTAGPPANRQVNCSSLFFSFFLYLLVYKLFQIKFSKPNQNNINLLHNRK
jgi:hypothetical protein